MTKHFAIIDIETTGGLVKRDRITEVAIVITDGKEILSEYEQLINPGISIPPHITRITGIDDEMVKDAPFFYEIAKDIVALTEGKIFVAHNVRFDYGFIRNAFAELGYPYNRKRMCTVQMARRLLRLKSHSLESLIRHYGISVDRRHRALDDAKATAIVLHNLLEMEGSKAHINKQINRGVRESLLPPSITIQDLHELPETSGLYYFIDKNETIIYIGKSNNIQKRVMSHFTKTTRKAEKLQSLVHRIDHKITGSELIAQIEEAHEIKSLKPEVNKAQRIANFNTYIKYHYNQLGYLKLDITRSIEEDDKILNAYSSPKAARAALTALTNEFGLCPIYTGIEIGMGACSLYQYERCYGACRHEEEASEYNERAEMALTHLDNRFKDDFAVIDSGRSHDEKSIVLVKDGQYFGHGFMPSDQSIESIEMISDMVEAKPFYPEINTMINTYILREKAERVLGLKVG